MGNKSKWIFSRLIEYFGVEGKSCSTYFWISDLRSLLTGDCYKGRKFASFKDFFVIQPEVLLPTISHIPIIVHRDYLILRLKIKR